MKTLEKGRLFGHVLVVLGGDGRRQMQNDYLLLRIAHIILQAVERGRLLNADCKRLSGGIRNLAKRLAERIRNRLIPPEATNPAVARYTQIRLNGP